jgi:uncharacterized protein
MGNYSVLRYIYENAGHSIDFDKIRTQHGFVPLTFAAYCNQPDIVSYLSLRVRDLNPVDPLGYTALTRCVMQGNFEAAMKLISRGANINLQNLDGRTALTLVIMEDHFQGALFLLEKGANPHIPDYRDHDSCDYARQSPTF